MSDRQFSYLFNAQFADGSSIQQEQGDPDVLPGKNAYSQVLLRHSEVVRFSVHSSEDPSRFAAVDLRTGDFYFDGLHIPSLDPSAGDLDDVIFRADKTDIPFRLIWFKRVYQHSHADGTKSSEIHYIFGWQITINDKCYKQTMRLV